MLIVFLLVAALICFPHQILEGEDHMKKARFRFGTKAVHTAVCSAIVACLSYSQPASAAMFEIEGSCITIFGYTICFHRDEDNAEGVRLAKRAAFPPPKPQ